MIITAYFKNGDKSTWKDARIGMNSDSLMVQYEIESPEMELTAKIDWDVLEEIRINTSEE